MDFTQMAHLEAWDEAGVDFLFGIDARSTLYEWSKACRKASGASSINRRVTTCRPSLAPAPERQEIERAAAWV